MRIEDQRAQRLIAPAARRRHALDDRLKDLGDADALFGRGVQHFLLRHAQHVLDLLGHHLRLGPRQIDLVQHRDNRQVVLQRQIDIGERLGLDALRRIHHQDRTLAGRQRARNLVGEIDMTGTIDQVQLVELPIVGLVIHSNSFGLDRDTLLAFEIHAVEQLVAPLA